MPIIDTFLNQRNFAVAVLVVLIANLIIGGVLLPYRQAQAVLALLPMQVTQWIVETLEYVWEVIEMAYQAAAEWISALIDEWDQMDTWLQRALEYAWYVLRKQLLNMLVNDIIGWIQGGGTPKVVTDWQGFLKKAANDAGGIFVDQYLGMGFLCQRFDAKIKIALATVPTFDVNVRCTFSQIVANINTFLNDFSQGGWRAWISVSETPNNMYGAYLMALDQKIGIQSEAQQAAQNEAVASAGFLGDKVCREIYDPTNPGGAQIGTWTTIPTGYVCAQWEVRTPGKIAAEAVTKAAGSEFDWLFASDEFEAYASAILDALISRVMKQGLTVVTSPGGGSAGASGPGITTSAMGAVAAATAAAQTSIAATQGAAMAGQLVPTLIQQVTLIGTNLNTYMGHLQSNLALLNQIQATQASALRLLGQMVQAGCALPAGVTQTTISSSVVNDCAQWCPCTTTTNDVIRIDSPGVGSITIQRTTTLVQGEPDLTGTSACVSVIHPAPCFLPPGYAMATCSTNVTTQILSTVVPANPDIATVTSQISAAQTQINQVNTANAALQNYQQASAAYTTISTQAGATQAQIAAALAAMQAAESQAVAALQALTGSTSTNLQALLQAVGAVSQQLVQADNAAQQKAGIAYCGFTQAGTYNDALCTAQATQSSYLTACNICLAGGGAWGGTGATCVP
jgi:hypothetical protein